MTEPLEFVQAKFEHLNILSLGNILEKCTELKSLWIESKNVTRAKSIGNLSLQQLPGKFVSALPPPFLSSLPPYSQKCTSRDERAQTSDCSNCHLPTTAFPHFTTQCVTWVRGFVSTTIHQTFSILAYSLRWTRCLSQGRAWLHVFCKAVAQKGTQLIPSLT